MQKSRRVVVRGLATACVLTLLAGAGVVFAPAANALTIGTKYDFGASAAADAGVYRDGAWFVSGSSTDWLGLPGDIPVPADYDGDGITERAIFRPAVGAWYIEGEAQPHYWGLSTDIPVPADYTGDGSADVAVYRPSAGGWYVEGQAAEFWGLPGDVPVPGNYDADANDELAVWRPAVGGWYVQGEAEARYLGLSTDVPVPGNYDADATDETAVWRPAAGAWFIDGEAQPRYLGLAGDIPVPADYDGSGTMEPAIYRDGAWFIEGQATQYIGLPGDIPLEIPYAIRSYQESLDAGPVAGEVLYRINAGGPEIAGDPVWAADTGLAQSPYLVNAANIYDDPTAIDITDPSIPAGTPMEIFQDQRYDPADGEDLHWSFPVAAGEYEVRLYLAEIYAPNAVPGTRVFDVESEGLVVLDNTDIGAEAPGAFKGIVRSFTSSTTDGNLDVIFRHVTENPSVQAIEVLTTDGSGTNEPMLGASPASITFPITAIGDTSPATVTVTNTGANGAGPLDVTGATITGAEADQFSVTFTAPFSLDVGQSANVPVSFVPTAEGAPDAVLELAHTGSNSPVTVDLHGVTPAGDGSDVRFRVNAGGPAVAGDPEWVIDTSASPSPYVAPGTDTFVSGAVVDVTDPTLPAGTPAAIFASERYDGESIDYTFPTGAGEYEVRLYFAETSPPKAVVGARVMDISIEGNLEFPDFDVFSQAGAGDKGIMRSVRVVAAAEGGDAEPDIEVSIAADVDIASIKGIEVVVAPPLADTTIGASPGNLAFGNAIVGESEVLALDLTHLGPLGAETVDITDVQLVGPWAEEFSQNFTGPVSLDSGQSTTVQVTYSPVTSGLIGTELVITHTGANSPMTIQITGAGAYGPGGSGISFGKSVLAGIDGPESPPTSIKWGPDGRLYIARLDGTIQVASIERTAENEYQATVDPVDLITSIRALPNHDDDGTPNPTLEGRMVTGIEVLGTAQNPIIYLVSSDPRIGSPQSGELDMDTNSGILSSLTWDGDSWEKRDLLRGLPRSKEQHSVQGVIHDETTGHLLLMAGGQTNNGAPSDNFMNVPEYALSAAILDVDIAALEAMPSTYDLPTLDDEARAGVDDANDPFGGNKGKNQARLVPGGPVQIYASGFRNAYDAVFTDTGLYTIDNGGNVGWGGAPGNEGPQGECLNNVDNGGPTYLDGLHRITASGYYGGHPNPTRGNMANTFNVSNPQSPVSVADPQECDFWTQDERPELTLFTSSTNGLDQYNADNFGGAMQGELIAAGWNNSVYRIELNSAGTAATNSYLFTNVGGFVLDVIASEETEPLPGVILAADYGTNAIYMFEPVDFDGGTFECTGADTTELDEDGDGYTNADEIDNGTNPCSAGDLPGDFDNDDLSNLNDPDDDNDGNPDVTDEFAIDPADGLTTAIPIDFPWDSDTPQDSGILNLGLTGAMTNGTTDWLSHYDPVNMTIIGAAGVITVDQTPNGDALGAQNDQQYAMHLGFDARPANANTFEASTSMPNPYGGQAPEAGHAWGLQVGTGTQDDYMKVVLAGANGGEMQVVQEIAGVPTVLATASVPMPGPTKVDVFLRVDPDTAMAQASYTTTFAGVTSARIPLGDPFAVPATWFDQGMAAGLIATSGGAATPLTASWDFLKVLDSPGTIAAPPPPEVVEWQALADQPLLYESLANVQLDGYMYLAGGGCQDGTTTPGCGGYHQRYDPATDTYTAMAPLPANIGHVQSVVVDGLIYYVGGLDVATDEEVGTVYAYDPATNTFATLTPMPAGRERGSSGVAVHGGLIYVAGGLEGPHFVGGAPTAEFDVYNPATDTWTSLTDLPGNRDHAQAAVVGDRLHLFGGRISANGADAMVTRTDVYDFTTSTWSSTAAAIPTARAAAAVAVVGTEIFVIGGETEPGIRAEVEAYDTLTDSWRSLPSMLTPRHGMAASVCANGIYVAGGSTAPFFNPSLAHEVLKLEGFGACPKP
jgi:N-acetylneuraminic acid mutarotase